MATKKNIEQTNSITKIKVDLVRIKLMCWGLGGEYIDKYVQFIK